MVLYGYDASTFNAIQKQDNWLAWVGLKSVGCPSLREHHSADCVEILTSIQTDTYMIGLINTVYSVGAIVSGWFVGGPTVSIGPRCMCTFYWDTSLPAE